MKNLLNTIKKYKDDENIVINNESLKLEQKTRNRIKTELTESLLKDLAEMADEAGDIIVTRIAKGIGISFDTSMGYLPATIEITMKNIDLDIEKAAEEFATKKAEKEVLRMERNAAKEEKMKADEIKREKKRAERAAKLMEK